MDDSDDFNPYGFVERTYDSDEESVTSIDDVDIFLDDWIQGSNRFDSFEFRYYTLDPTVPEEGYNDDSLFVETIMSGLRELRCVTAVRLLADIYDLNNEEDVKWSQNIRYEIDQFSTLEELHNLMLEHISNETAPIWHRLMVDEISSRLL